VARTQTHTGALPAASRDGADCMWNVPVGLLVGVALHHLNRHGLLRL
jgi:hypothetical protein